jgi:hypothetical protein
MAKQYRLKKGSLHDKFLNSRAKIQFMGGGFGNGKTSAAVNKALIIAQNYPGSNILIARATYPKLNDTIRKAVLDEWCPKDWIKRRPTKDDNTLVLKNDSTINFRYVAQRGKTSEDGTTSSNLLSANYDLVVVDQIEDPEISYKDFTDLMGRLRGSAKYIGNDPTMPASGPRWMILTANPSMNWVYQKLVKPVYDYKQKGLRSEDLIVDPVTNEPMIELFEGSTYDNSLNLDEDYIRGLEATYKGQQRERYLMGGWAAYEGLVYPGFDERIHVVEHATLLAYLRERAAVLRRNFLRGLSPRAGYDYGLVNPSCFLLGATDPEHGITFVFDGFYQKEYKIDEQSDHILGLQLEHRGIFNGSSTRPYSYPPIYADPAIFRRGGDKGTTIAGVFADAGVPMFRGGNAVATGIAKVTELLAEDEFLTHPITNKESSPRLIISSKLDFLASEFTSYYWKKNPYGHYTDEPTDKDDHALDTLKYLLTDMPKVEQLRAYSTERAQVFRWREREDSSSERDYRHG